MKMNLHPFWKKILDTLSAIRLLNLDSSILSHDKDSKEIREIRKYYLKNYLLLEYLSKLINNNSINIVNSGSKGKIDNVIQNLMSVGIQAVLQSCYSEGLTAKELFIHSKSSRVGIIPSSLNTSSTGYMQRELFKSMEDSITDKEGFVHDYNNDEIYYYPFFYTNIPDIDDSFLEYAFLMLLKKTDV
ncbi:beta and beta-prime subunits of DNA dependent RNA-polymerase [Piromyces finnis]|uniref:DNA-directed RNA polymerase n=1 Tax=Piromyces finnis TaxID=1754191 RepID=A0A1Y1UQY7_9FUNG|nr:beta and beta-prime subunits of DNA dependent RNA-polymerase [Piromyces finnis]|eukprot:ORX40399.1 beta and beta-prime subunits of DNA dependent RNA-polymerase [Piromyces finnis]